MGSIVEQGAMAFGSSPETSPPSYLVPRGLCLYVSEDLWFWGSPKFLLALQLSKASLGVEAEVLAPAVRREEGTWCLESAVHLWKPSVLKGGTAMVFCSQLPPNYVFLECGLLSRLLVWQCCPNEGVTRTGSIQDPRKRKGPAAPFRLCKVPKVLQE